MNQTLRFMFGSPQRVIVTAIIGFILWGMVDPVSVRDLVAKCWGNFWMAFGPIIQMLLQLLILGGGIWLMVRGIFKKAK